MNDILPPLYKPLTAGEVQRLISVKVCIALTELGTLGMLWVRGVLGPVRSSKYSMVYGIELRDNKGEILLLDIPLVLKPETMANKEVEVFGQLRAKKGSQVILEVIRMHHTAEVNPEVLEEEKALRNTLIGPNFGPDVFPQAIEGLTVSFIHGSSSAVKADFLRQVETLNLLSMDSVPVNLQDSDSLLGGIRGAQGEVLVLIRGGGGDGEFEIFNRPQILEEWRLKKAFKIVAIGHTENYTLLDRLAHKICGTPTEAGVYIREQVDSQTQKVHLRQQVEQSAQNTAAALSKAQGEWSKSLEGLQAQLREVSNEKAAMAGAYANLQAEVVSLRRGLQLSAPWWRQVPFLVWVIAGGLLILAWVAGLKH